MMGIERFQREEKAYEGIIASILANTGFKVREIVAIDELHCGVSDLTLSLSPALADWLTAWDGF